MDTVGFYRETIEKIMQRHEAIPFQYGEIKQHVIVNETHNQFFLDQRWLAKPRADLRECYPC